MIGLLKKELFKVCSSNNIEVSTVIHAYVILKIINAFNPSLLRTLALRGDNIVFDGIDVNIVIINNTEILIEKKFLGAVIKVYQTTLFKWIFT